jgi:transcriptional regulator with XRE-family HTH domain
MPLRTLSAIKSLSSCAIAEREAEDFSQTAFAKKIGLSVQNLNDLEKGRRIPTPSRAARIAKKLGLPVKFIAKAWLQSHNFNNNQAKPRHWD